MGVFDKGNWDDITAGGIVTVPDGTYACELSKAALEMTKAGDGEIVAWAFTVLDGEHAGHVIMNWDLVNKPVDENEMTRGQNPKPKWEMRLQIIKRKFADLGIEFPSGVTPREAIGIGCTQAVGKLVNVTVSLDVDTRGSRNNVTAVVLS